MAISDLTKLVKPPSNPKDLPLKKSWAAIEKKLKLTLPDDYKKYIETYGSGLLGNFIIVLNPFSKIEGVEFFSSIELLSSTLRELKQIEGDEYIPYEVYPSSPGLLAWGADENGNGLYWLTKGARNKWPVVVCAGRDNRYQHFDMGMTSFLAKTFTGEIKCKIWPASFAVPKRRFDFQPY